jgi:pimeloyl-ACP methyl ester carboxylesterase
LKVKKAIKRWWWILLLIPVLLVGGFIVWAMTPLGPMPEALAALESDAQVQVEQGQWYVFRPVEGSPDTGIILYPGGRVDPRSYAPQAHALAAAGYLAVIVPMPLNLAVFNPEAAAQVMAAYPEITDWAAGGHSLGGAMAANFARQNPELLDGLFFWAAYPASSDDLSGLDLAVISIYATLDGLMTGAEVEASRARLPADTAWTAIEGGNHAQFGWYGDQPGDNPATISREQQQAQVLEAMLLFLEGGKGGG